MHAYISRNLRTSFSLAIKRITQTLEAEGFTVTTINISHALKNSLNIDFRNYTCLSAFCPELAYQAVSLESHAGLMMPCAVIVQEHENGEIEISANSVLEMPDEKSDVSTMSAISRKLSLKLRRAMDNLNLLP